MIVNILIACFSLYTSFLPDPNGAMARRSQSSVGFRVLPVGVPSFTVQLLLILCGRLLDAQAQGKNEMFSIVLFFFAWLQNREHA